jgi:hypothetical protein
MTRTRCSHLVAALCAALAAGCSDGVARQSLTAPSPIQEVTAAADPRVSVNAAQMAASGDAARATTWALNHGWSATADGLTVEGTDTISQVAGTCPTATITIRNVPVALTSTTVFSAPLTCASLAAGTKVTVTAVLTFTDAGFTVEATKVTPADPAATPSVGTKVEGVVATVTGTCPTRTITLEGTSGVIVTTASTKFDPSGFCDQIVPGSQIEAVGTRNAEGQLVATKVEPSNDDEQGGNSGRGKKGRGEGVVGAITGSCPTLTLVITGTKVSTTATTEWKNGTCESLRPGTKVKIDGELRPGGTAVAEKIEIERAPGRKVSGDGKVDSVDGTCPSLTINVRGVMVMTSDTTTFTGGLCGDVARGAHIDVTGDYDGTSVEATAVHIKKK